MYKNITKLIAQKIKIKSYIIDQKQNNGNILLSKKNFGKSACENI